VGGATVGKKDDSVMVGSALLVLNRGNDMGWDSTLVLASGAIAVVTLPLLIITERRATGALYRHTLLLFQSRSGFINRFGGLMLVVFRQVRVARCTNPTCTSPTIENISGEISTNGHSPSKCEANTQSGA
jgi:hypothetical protein